MFPEIDKIAEQSRRRHHQASISSVIKRVFILLAQKKWLSCPELLEDNHIHQAKLEEQVLNMIKASGTFVLWIQVLA